MESDGKLSQAQVMGRKYGGVQGRKAALIFESKTLAWLAKFKFTNNHVIASLFKISPATARDKLKKLEKKGFVRKVPCLSVRDNWVYILSHAGVHRLREQWNIQAHSPWLDVTKIRDRTKATHDLCVQFFCAIQHSSGSTKFIKSEFEIGNMPIHRIKLTGGTKKNQRHRPDAVIEHWSSEDERSTEYIGCWAVEYESVRKSVARLEEIFGYHYQHCMSNEKDRVYWGVHYIFSRMSDVSFYTKQLELYANRIFPVRWTHVEGSSEYDQNKDAREKFLECFKFHMIHKELRFAFYHNHNSLNLAL